MPETTPVNRPILSAEKWYQDAKEPETEFEGKLDVNPGDGRIGLSPRYCAFRIIGVEEGKPIARLVYSEGRDQLLGAYVGKRLKLLGKVVSRDAEGGKVIEFWPGQLLTVSGDAGESIGEVKVLARTARWIPARRTVAPQAFVVRDAATLAQLGGMAGGGAETAAERSLCQVLESRPGASINNIDWKKQMVIAVSGGIQPSGGAKVEITRLLLQEKGLDVTWKLLTQPGGVGLPPTETLLVPRFDGEVRFFKEGVRQPIIVPAAAAPVPMPAPMAK
jgi:hypothetical protein